MGNKVSIDSATLMNKGFEAIAARWLFDLKPEQIEVVMHPQSIIHSFVYFEDASVKAQMSRTDMRIPIQFALTYPNRLKNSFEQLDLAKIAKLEFAEIDTKKFTNLALAFEAMKSGGNMPCKLNASNEVAVRAFLEGKIGFNGIGKIVGQLQDKVDFIENPSLDDLFETDLLLREKANEMIKKINI
jgi:1-deoxy-D-xylulose-5-phosphate reductoisomerase